MEPVKPVDVKSAAPVQAATPEPAKPVQPTPAAATPAVVTPKPEVKPAEPTQVPLPVLLEERTKRQQLEAEVAQLRQLTQPQQYQQPVQQQQPAFDPRAELEKLWDSDPRKAVQAEIMFAMDWRDQVDAQLNIQADNLAMKYPDFNNFRSAALGYVRSLPVHQRGANGILDAAYFMVKGQNYDLMLQRKEEELIEKYRRGEITAAQLVQPSGTFSHPASSEPVQLTPDQIRVAEAMGLSMDGYASQIKLKPPVGV